MVYALLFCVLSLTGLALLSACETVIDDRIPRMPVSIDLSNTGVWNSYGVAGFGDFNYFVLINGSPTEPAGFPYKNSAATGYGGVLLIEGMDPFSLETSTPLAYDLSCPVERSRTVRVAVHPDRNYIAICPVCHSEYDVTMAGGAPLAGPAATGKHKYGLRRYYCRKTTLGGYYITDY